MNKTRHFRDNKFYSNNWRELKWESLTRQPTSIKHVLMPVSDVHRLVWNACRCAWMSRMWVQEKSVFLGSMSVHVFVKRQHRLWSWRLVTQRICANFVKQSARNVHRNAASSRMTTVKSAPPNARAAQMNVKWCLAFNATHTGLKTNIYVVSIPHGCFAFYRRIQRYYG